MIADSDKKNLDQLALLFREKYGITPLLWENEQTFQEFIRQPEGGAVFVRIGNVRTKSLVLSSLAMEFSPTVQLVWMADSDAYALDAFAHGADAYLLLPADENNLGEVVASLISKQNKSK